MTKGNNDVIFKLCIDIFGTRKSSFDVAKVKFGLEDVRLVLENDPLDSRL